MPLLPCYLQFHNNGVVDHWFWITEGSRKRLLKKDQMNSLQDAECASYVQCKESEESISQGYVCDCILCNVLMKSQVIKSENWTLQKKLALYAYEFKHLPKNVRTVDAIKSEHVRSELLSDLKSVVGMGDSTNMDNV